VEWLELDERRSQSPTRLPLDLRSAFDIVNTPTKASWLLRPYLEEYAIAVLTGDYGTFKSFLALDWALHLATGKHWHNDPRGSK
jgi:AAA domain